MKKTVTAILFFLLSFAAAYGESTLTVNFAPGRVILNPQVGYTTKEAQIYTALYEGLVSYEPQSLRPEPGMAESWDISRDGLTYTFNLREGLVWSDGSPLTAEQLRLSWLQLLNMGEKAYYVSLLDPIEGVQDYRQGRVGPEAIGLEAPDERTFIIRLNSPTPYFLQTLCHYVFVPVHPSRMGNFGDWSEEAVFGNGPYRFSPDSLGRDKLLLEKNPLYWDQARVAYEKLEIIFSEDKDELMELFRLYEVDWIASGWGSEVPEREKIVLSPLFATSYLFFNNRQSPWDNPKVRTGLALLLPWEEIRGPEFFPTGQLVPSIQGYPRIEILEEDKERGLELLKEAGYPGGTGLPPIRLRVPYEEQPVVEAIRRRWGGELGLDVSIEVLPYESYYDSLREDGYTLGQISWIGDFADPMTFLKMWLSDSSLNDAGFSDPEYDRLVAEGTGEDRYELLAQAEEILLLGGQVLPISHSLGINFIDLRFIEGWFPNVLDIHPFKHIRPGGEYEIPGSV